MILMLALFLVAGVLAACDDDNAAPETWSRWSTSHNGARETAEVTLG
jgi:hypothetical protein